MIEYEMVKNILFMMKMNVYERHAYLYSAWTALLVPCILSMVIAWDILP